MSAPLHFRRMSRLEGSITERLYRAIWATRIYEGSAEVMKIVIAPSVLGDG